MKIQASRPRTPARRPAAETRSRIAAATAPLLNQRGYSGTSIADVLEATGLEKGGLYNHFASKEALAVAAFEHSMTQLDEFFSRRLRGVEPGLPYLHAFVDAFAAHAEDPVVEGGCPLVNTAADADDTVPALRERVVVRMQTVIDRLERHARRAIETGALRAPDARAVALTIFCAIEGVAMLSRATRSRQPVKDVAASLHAFLGAQP